MGKSIEYVGTLTSKGQVTIPSRIRRELGLKKHDKLVFRLVDGKLVVEAMPMKLEAVYGSVEPINRPEDFDAIRRIAREERAERTAHKSAS